MKKLTMIALMGCSFIVGYSFVNFRQINISDDNYVNASSSNNIRNGFKVNDIETDNSSNGRIVLYLIKDKETDEEYIVTRVRGLDGIGVIHLEKNNNQQNKNSRESKKETDFVLGSEMGVMRLNKKQAQEFVEEMSPEKNKK